MSLFNTLPKEIDRAFSSGEALGQYLDGHEAPIVFRGITLVERSVNGSTLENVVFENVNLKNFNLEEGIIRNVRIEGGDSNLSLTKSVIDNLHFKDVKINRINMTGAKVKNMVFENCIISTGVAFSGSVGDITLINTKVKEIRGTRSKGMTLALKENSEVQKLDFTYSKGENSFIAHNSKVGEADFEYAEMVGFELLNSSFSQLIGPETVKDKVTIKGGSVYMSSKFITTPSILFDNVIIPKLVITAVTGSFTIKNSPKIGWLSVISTEADSFILDGATVSSFSAADAGFKNLSITNSKLYNSSFWTMYVENVTFNNVVLGGKVNFNKARYHKQANFENVSLLEGGHTFTNEGSNFSF